MTPLPCWLETKKLEKKTHEYKTIFSSFHIKYWKQTIPQTLHEIVTIDGFMMLVMLHMVEQIFKVVSQSFTICHFTEGEHIKKMLTLYCCHVVSCWLIKISLLNCSTPYIFYLPSHLIKKYDKRITGHGNDHVFWCCLLKHL